MASAQITVYYQQTFQHTQNQLRIPEQAAYDPTILEAPAIPDPLPPYAIRYRAPEPGTHQGYRYHRLGNFVGFSIEMSVTNQLLGKNSSYIQVPFLNLMANLEKRGGRVNTAVLVESLDGGRMIHKDVENVSNPTETPPLDYTTDLFYIMRNISDLVNVYWYLGIPFYNTSEFQLAIAEQGQAILGDYLLGLQAGNEPDLYQRHGHRSDATGHPEMVWDTGFVDMYNDNLAYLSVEHYPSDNCAAQYGSSYGEARDPQMMFPRYLNHTAGQALAKLYLNSTSYAQNKGKPLIMFETNTASCGGFPGVSDSFGAALWGLDYAMQLAYSNFSGALMHVGGQGVYYNVSPPTNQSTFRQWTIGPIYYSALVIAEALGSSESGSQIADLNANDGNIYTPAYAIYESGNPVRVALFNYITDPSGASNYTASIYAGENVQQVRVKYLSADSVSQKGSFKWAGQTFGDHFASDGRLMGDEDVRTSLCLLRGSHWCFFVHDEVVDVETQTFPTTVQTRTVNTATVAEGVLATSNGHHWAAGGGIWEHE
ncbi:glycoside hydrolase family 79 protein [Desarmillaria tabescens]|uniref:Glycoside hydrolase family 79 protein n=1 Tax=Armillaria tabescens TaxID=1929756 RepID=A0AA39JS89_ARMTA|nr:glycoside hydrolase family 79 protein [Desarmillaria tabescens]KAK0445633.1 glycoside hydrolase family 79 protein [Desarmillaria tabescens]